MIAPVLIFHGFFTLCGYLLWKFAPMLLTFPWNEVVSRMGDIMIAVSLIALPVNILVWFIANKLGNKRAEGERT